MSKIGLTQKDKQQLITWIGKGPKSFHLLYSCTRDGCSASAFHQKCDNKGPTVTVLYNTNSSVYGGYTNASWSSSVQNYVADNAAFLFQLKFNGTETFNKFAVSTSYVGNAIYSHSNNGPVFGAGHEINTFSGSITKSGTYFPFNGSTSFQAGYYSCSINNTNITNGHMNIMDMEVYLVKDGIESAGPWRKAPGLNKETLTQLMEKIESYSPMTGVDASFAKILLIGQVGAGKSSFFNTINSIFQGRIAQQGCSGSSEHSLTTVYREYKIKSRKTGKALKFQLCDMCGLEETLGPDQVELNYLISGNIPDKYQFNASCLATTKIPGFIEEPKLQDRVHCVVYVIDASTVDVLPKPVLEKFRQLQLRMNMIGLPRVVLLTKIDKLSKDIEEDVSMVYENDTVRETVETVSQLMGIPRGNVLIIKNYESEMDLDDKISCLALLALERMLNFADDYLSDQ